MSATFQEGNQVSYPSAYDFTVGGTVNSCPYLLVKLNASGQVVLAAASTDLIVGVIRNCPTAVGGAATPSHGQVADVHVRNSTGQFKVQLGSTVTLGAYLTTNSSGQAVASTTAGDQVFGIAEQAGISGQFITYRCANYIHP